MEEQKLRYFRKKLIEEKRRVTGTIDDLDDSGLDNSLRDDTSELSTYDNHPADIASETFEFEKNSALKANEVEQLKMIDRAIDRIESGEYGTCRICGRSIAEERLAAIPSAELCIDCENKRNDAAGPSRRDRPVEEDVIGENVGGINRDEDDHTGYDGEDTWQDLESYNSPNYMLWDGDEDDESDGNVEDTDRISNEQYKRQLPD